MAKMKTPLCVCAENVHFYRPSVQMIFCIRTLGRVPDVPVPSRLMSVNKTVITLDLEAFGDGGCPILYFVIEYR